MSDEIDIMEDFNGLNETSGTLHCGNLTQRNSDGTFGPCHEKAPGRRTADLHRMPAGFHANAVIGDRRDADGQQIRWYLDGRQFSA